VKAPLRPDIVVARGVLASRARSGDPVKLQEHKARQEQYNFRSRFLAGRISGGNATDGGHGERTRQKTDKKGAETLPPDVTVIITIMRVVYLRSKYKRVQI